MVVCGDAEIHTAVLPVTKEGAVVRQVELSRFLYAPVAKGEKVGQVRYLLAGETVAEVPLIAQNTVSLPPKKKSWWESLLDFLCGRG